MIEDHDHDHDTTNADGTLIDIHLVAGVALRDHGTVPYPLTTLELTIRRDDGTEETVRTFGVEPALANDLGLALIQAAAQALLSHDRLRRLN